MLKMTRIYPLTHIIYGLDDIMQEINNDMNY